MGGCITIGEDCWIAGNIIILPGVSVGDGCTIGAGSGDEGKSNQFSLHATINTRLMYRYL